MITIEFRQTVRETHESREMFKNLSLACVILMGCSLMLGLLSKRMEKYIENLKTEVNNIRG